MRFDCGTVALLASGAISALPLAPGSAVRSGAAGRRSNRTTRIVAARTVASPRFPRAVTSPPGAACSRLRAAQSSTLDHLGRVDAGVPGGGFADAEAEGTGGDAERGARTDGGVEFAATQARPRPSTSSSLRRGRARCPRRSRRGARSRSGRHLQAGLCRGGRLPTRPGSPPLKVSAGRAGVRRVGRAPGARRRRRARRPDATLPRREPPPRSEEKTPSPPPRRRRRSSVPLEELWWVSRLIPHVLADPFEGEIPLPPDAVAEVFQPRRPRQRGEPRRRALVRVHRPGVPVPGRRRAHRVVSPRLMETLCWGAARWADTYLMPEDTGGSVHAALLAGRTMGLGADDGGEGRVYRGSNKAKPASFSRSQGGVRATDALLRVALTALTAWPGEAGVQRVAAATLLRLTRRRALCRACVQLPSWGSILDVEARAAGARRRSRRRGGNRAAGSVAGGVAFPTEIHRATCEAIGRAAEGVKGEAQCRSTSRARWRREGAALRAVANGRPCVDVAPGARRAPSRRSRRFAGPRAPPSPGHRRPCLNFSRGRSTRFWWCNARGRRARKSRERC